MSEVRLPLLRGVHAHGHTHTPSTANMAAQRGKAFLRDDGGEDRSKIGQQVDQNDQNEATARLATLERRLEERDQAHQEAEARMANMMARMMDMYDANEVLDVEETSPS